MKYLNVLLMTIVFIAWYGEMREGYIFHWTLAWLLIICWEFKLNDT